MTGRMLEMTSEKTDCLSGSRSQILKLQASPGRTDKMSLEAVPQAQAET